MQDSSKTGYLAASLATRVPTRIPTRVAGDAAKRLAVCAGLLALLMGWAVVFPQTGDGDAIMHYLNAHDSLWQPAKLMGSWARVGAKIPLLIPAQYGVLGARWAAALISIVCAWQTIRLADDLKIRRSILAAAFLLFQPYVFTLAGDTMTELPLALGIVIAIRFWLARRKWASCLVMGYLPTVRPEGFFLCALWAAMVLGREGVGTWRWRGAMLLTLFEWWRMRRRFVALAAMTDALSRLDYKYKAMFAKAELRLQQLYGRRRGGITEGQPRPKMPEEIEIERLNDELKQILELHLQRLGARLPGARRRKGWRELFGGGDVGSTVEARSYRR